MRTIKIEDMSDVGQSPQLLVIVEELGKSWCEWLNNDGRPETVDTAVQSDNTFGEEDADTIRDDITATLAYIEEDAGADLIEKIKARLQGDYDNAVLVDGPDGVRPYSVYVNMMDDDIREELHAELSPCTCQEFLDAYCKAHEEKYGEEFHI